MRLHQLISLVAIWQITAAADAQVISKSPDGMLAVQLRTMKPEPTGQDQVVEIIETKTQKVLYSWKSAHRSTEVLWSDDSRFFAINDRVANSGDSLYVFAVDFDGQRLKPLRLPDERQLEAAIKGLHTAFAGFEHCSIAADRWDGDRLWTRVSGRSSTDNQGDKAAQAFDFLWLYLFPHHSAPVLMEEWTQTFRYER